MNFKKIISFILALSLVSVPLYSCDKNENSQTPENSSADSDTSGTEAETGSGDADSKDDEASELTYSLPTEEEIQFADLGDGIIANIGGYDITEDEFKYYLYYAKTSIDGGDDTYWDDDEDGAKLHDLKEQTLMYVYNNSAIYKLAENYSVHLDPEEIQITESQYQKDILYYNQANGTSIESFEEYLKEIMCTEEVYKESYRRQQLENKTVAALYEDDYRKNYFSDYICVKYIMVKNYFTYQTDEDGKKTTKPEKMYELIEGLTYTDEEKEMIDKINSFTENNDEEGLKAFVPEFMKMIEARLEAGDDFDTLMTKYNCDSSAPINSDGSYAGYYINGDVMPEEFTAAAYALEEGEYTKESVFSNVYYIIKREPFDEEYLKNYLIYIYMGSDEYPYLQEYETLCRTIQKSLKVTLSNEFENITATSLFK
ncbi:MAG: hypothetical protein PUE12_00550 [Oscillospiraceae bacterium]|nr:hypothetical protein [Oscillospiraceae bacterium]